MHCQANQIQNTNRKTTASLNHEMKHDPIRQFGKQLNMKQNLNPATLHPRKNSKQGKSKRILIVGSNNDLNNKENLSLVVKSLETSKQDQQTKEKPTIYYKIQSRSDPQRVCYYKENIFSYLLQKEFQLQRKLIDPNFMHRQLEISEQQRLYVVDHLMKICHSFRLKDESFFMAVELMDSYLTKHIIKIIDIELIAITSLFIATKFEEIYPPQLGNLLQRTSYTKSDVLNQEAKMLDARQFDLIGNTSLGWLNLLYDQIEQEQKNVEAYDFSKYILETVLLRTCMYHHKPSEIALGSLVVVQKWMKLPEYNLLVVDQLVVEDIILRKLGCIFTQIVQKKDLFVNKKYSITAKFQQAFENAKLN